jgi:hypothetical protein
MNTSRTAEPIVYNFPPQIIERQRYVNFLASREPDGVFLAWFIHPETRRLIGVWFWKENLLWASFDRNGKNLTLYKRCRFIPGDDFWSDLKRAPCGGVMSAIKEYIGIVNHGDAKPEGKLVPFPGVTLPYAPPAGADKPDGKEETEAFSKRVKNLRMQGVPSRSIYALAYMGFGSLPELAQADPKKLRRGRNVGKKTLAELKARLLECNLILCPAWAEYEAREAGLKEM